MKNSCYKKTLVLGIIVLFVGMSITPSTGNIMFFDDTTPPVTTISFDPPEPDGENSWYVSDVTVTLNATDDLSGVNATYYRINGGEWETYDSPFVISGDGDDILIEFYSIDNAGNQESHKHATIDMDQTEPDIEQIYEVIGGDLWHGWDLLFTATATDDMSGMHRVEFYISDKLQETVIGPGPTYEWEVHYSIYFRVRGLIRNLEITEEYVKFYAIIVIISELPFHNTYSACAYDNAGNSAEDEIYAGPLVSFRQGIYLFQSLTLPNNYTGYIGRFFISAIFNNS